MLNSNHIKSAKAPKLNDRGTLTWDSGLLELPNGESVEVLWIPFFSKNGFFQFEGRWFKISLDVIKFNSFMEGKISDGKN